MRDPGEGSTFRNVFYTLGYALGEAEARLGDGEPRPGEAEAVPPPAAAAGEIGVTGAEPVAAGAEADAGIAAGAALGATAAAWLLARLFRPVPIRWPRALLAGLVGTALMDRAYALERRIGTVPADATAPNGAPHYVAGLATAAAYASLVYPRLPGSPVMRGLLFGALEASATRAGGAFALLRRLSPHVAYPLEALGPPGLPVRGPLSALAFGLGLGLYRDGAEARE